MPWKDHLLGNYQFPYNDRFMESKLFMGGRIKMTACSYFF